MNIVITGASRGLGAELVKLFTREGDHRVLALSRNLNALEILRDHCLECNPGARLWIHAFDLTRFSATLPLIMEVVSKEIGHVDILVNNAGLLVRKAFHDMDPAKIDETMAVNFSGPARLIQELLPFLGGMQPSHVVNIGSMGGFQGSVKFPGLSFYSASKAAIACLTECLAEEYKGQSIYFNCLALGAAGTEMFTAAFPGAKAPLRADEMALFIYDFALNGYRYFNGKVLPVSIVNP
jgi:3-oxoacyl-[acyl-carrier protein] reductase